MIKTIIFDLDGTLLNTIGDLTDAVNFVMRSYGEPEHTEEEVLSFVGNGNRNLMIRAIPDGENCPTFEEQFAAFKEYYVAHDCVRTAPYDGILELLTELKTRGVKMGIVSNKMHDAVVSLSKHFFADTIDFACGVGEGRQIKPARDIPDAVMQALSADPETTVYIGDSDVDFKTASNAKLPCLLVSWGFRPRSLLESFLTEGAVGIADSPAEILEMLDEMA